LGNSSYIECSARPQSRVGVIEGGLLARAVVLGGSELVPRRGRVPFGGRVPLRLRVPDFGSLDGGFCRSPLLVADLLQRAHRRERVNHGEVLVLGSSDGQDGQHPVKRPSAPLFKVHSQTHGCLRGFKPGEYLNANLEKVNVLTFLPASVILLSEHELSVARQLAEARLVAEQK